MGVAADFEPGVACDRLVEGAEGVAALSSWFRAFSLPFLLDRVVLGAGISSSFRVDAGVFTFLASEARGSGESATCSVDP